MNLERREEKILEQLSESGLIEDFYLAGGTALALRYHHRTSEDLDFFTQNTKLSLLSLRDKLFLFSQEKGFKLDVHLAKEDTLILKIENLLCSFFHYPYKLLEEPERIMKIKVAGDKDIACMKAIAISQRGSKKDFFDLYFLMNKHGWNISKIIDFCKAKYENVFPEEIFIKALVYFEDAEKEYYPEIESSWEKVKRFFIESVKSYFDKIRELK